MAKSHVVQSGDTLGAIAKRLGTSVGNLTGFRSGNANLIFPGETISVKNEPTSAPTDRASTIRNELTDTPKTENKKDNSNSSFGGFDFESLQSSLKDTQGKKEDAFKKLDGFQTNRYNDLVKERDLDGNRDAISSLDSQITQKKQERDNAINKIRSNPGASAATITGEKSRATDLLNDEINNLIGQRNSKAGEYNTALSEIDSIVGREAKDLQTSLGFFTDQETNANSLIEAYQKALTDELRREEDRGFAQDDDLRDFEQALEIARLKDSGGGTNYTILNDKFGRPTVAIDKKNPTNQIDLSGTEGSTPKNGSDPELLQSLENQQETKKSGGIGGFFKRLFGGN